MKDGNYYMNEVRKAKGLKSFNEVGRLLGVSGNAISLIRRGGGISETNAEKIGKILNTDSGIIFADIHAAGAKDKTIRKFWTNVSKHLGTAASLLLSLPALLYSHLYILC